MTKNGDASATRRSTRRSKMRRLLTPVSRIDRSQTFRLLHAFFVAGNLRAQLIYRAFSILGHFPYAVDQLDGAARERLPHGAAINAAR
jgi:hypothetical protein